MVLSKRLQTIASFVPPGSRVVDVGTDHGYIPIYLVKNEISPGAIAMDVRSGPLKRAAEHVQQEGLEGQIALRLSDGLEALKEGEADTAVISGLGGLLMQEILRRGQEVAGTIRYFVLSPQSDIPGVRVFLRKNGYRIEKEAFIKDEGKYYTVMLAVHGESGPSCYIDDQYGGYLLRQGDPVLKEYLNREKRRLCELLPILTKSPKEETRKRCEQVRMKLTAVEQALRKMEEG